MKSFVLDSLPFGGRGIAKEKTAPHWSNGVNPAKFAGLEGTGGGGGLAISNRRRSQVAQECGQFDRGHVKAMPIFLKPAAPARDLTHRAAAGNFRRQIAVKGMDRLGHISPVSGPANGGGKIA